ncbi:MAG: hypothetical protein AM325_013960 [Candidatus Thorarchaeota archaeon SMTZ1-45]|nr:MAG: hypothetical protein AM325_15475 [Candidatus Thorarchaeota archaeon SMTZ1-45]
MSENKQKLIDLVMRENVSSIQIIADRLEITDHEVIKLINGLIDSGELIGALTEDSKRFYKSEVKLSQAPKIEREDTLPSFLSFNTKPAVTTAIVGIIVLAGGLVVNAFATDEIEGNFAAILILFGMMIFVIGLYSLSKRKTPA